MLEKKEELQKSLNNTPRIILTPADCEQVESFSKKKEQGEIIKTNSDNNEEFFDQIPKRARENKLYKFFYMIATNKFLNIVVMLFIVANTIILAFDRHPISKEEFRIIQNINSTFTWCFLAEMIIKLIGLGIKSYF